MIDGGLFLGRNPSTSLEFTPQALKAYFKSAQVSAAIVTHFRSLFLDAHEGNDTLLSLAKEFKGAIIPAISISPYYFDSIQDRNYFKNLKAQGAKIFGVYLTPQYVDIQLESPLLKTMTEWAVEAGLAVQFGIRTPLDLAKVLQYYRDLKGPVLIRWMAGRNYYSLAETIEAIRTTSHFYFDVGALVNAGGIKNLVERGGADRLYMASNQPEAFEYTSRFLLETAQLAPSDYKKIAHDNLAKLFGISTVHTDTSSGASWKQHWDRLMKFSKIDTHIHTDGWNILEPLRDAVNFKEYFTHYGYKKIVISPVRGLNDDFVIANAETEVFLKKNEGVYGLVTIDPYQPDISIAQIKKYGANKRFVGIKTIQDHHGTRLNDDGYLKIFKAVQKFNFPVMAHIPGMVEVAKQFPKMRFVCAHATWGRVKSFVKQKNIYFDIATSHHDVFESQLDRLVREAGDDRVIYSCDAQLMHPAWTLGKIASYSFKDATLKKIFYDNATKAFPRLSGK